MDLGHAIYVVGRPVWVEGRSDKSLIDTITSHPAWAGGKPLSPALGLEAGAPVRPVDVLMRLAYVTRPRFQDDVYDAYLQWALMRYLGIFDLWWDGQQDALCLSDAGRRIVGNQRRVASEDLGIGFGALLAERWIESLLRASVPIRMVDVDVALADGGIVAGGAVKPVQQTSAHRPDYLVVVDDPTIRGRFRVKVLECKGTKSRAHSLKQLVHAANQLGGLSVAGRVPQGLAVSTVVTNRNVAFSAIDPSDDDDIYVDLDDLGRATRSEFRLPGYEGGNRISEEELGAVVGASLRSSWANLADFGGNSEGYFRWAPPSMREKQIRAPRDRAGAETPIGDAYGIRASFTIQSRQLDVFYGIEATIDRFLSGGDEGAITEAQLAFAQRTSDLKLAVSEESFALSAGSDGAILYLQLR